MQIWLIILIDTIIIFLLNIPYGMWRGRVKKFSFEWFCSIHLPIPYIIAIRHWSGIGFEWWTYPFFLTAFFTGQLLGKHLSKKKKAQGKL